QQQVAQAVGLQVPGAHGLDDHRQRGADEQGGGDHSGKRSETGHSLNARYPCTRCASSRLPICRPRAWVLLTISWCTPLVRRQTAQGAVKGPLPSAGRQTAPGPSRALPSAGRGAAQGAVVGATADVRAGAVVVGVAPALFEVFLAPVAVAVLVAVGEVEPRSFLPVA